MTEIRTTSRTGGQKGVKPARFDLIPVGALTALAEHYGAGAAKYDDNQWRKGYEWSKSYAALQRHLTAWWNGEDVDEETGSSHLDAVAWHAFTLRTFVDEHPDFDDRYRQPAKVEDADHRLLVSQAIQDAANRLTSHEPAWEQLGRMAEAVRESGVGAIAPIESAH
jgi:hypothetical protein